MTKRPALWVLLAVVAMAAAMFSWRYFTQAFPLVSIDIRMDRQAALAAARLRAAALRIGPPDFQDAASFTNDESVQTFVELEGGGKPAFAALVGDRQFTPYRWRVRHFKERETHEATFSFAPDGTPNGFVERIKEDLPGAALSEAAARALAESTAIRSWGVDLTPFQPVEHSQEDRPGNRIDHTFVYERPDRPLGDGRYRLRLVVSGDRLTELTYLLQVPDAFTRKYDQMRSANTAIGVAGSLALVVLYGVGGIAFGLFVLGRQRRVIWRQPVFWGTAVALAQAGATLNEWPLAWMNYDTALSTRSFIAQQIALSTAEFAATAVMFSLSFMAAESLTRRAFGSHPLFWRIWNRHAGASRAVLGRTMAGYLLVPVFIAYEVALYLFATRSLGWWTPSDALFNPDVLASYAPWFSAIAKSFQAGFWEESLFRAVPIAGAALIGEKFGHRRLWIVAAFVVQAVIFGAGHAPYPTQPAYARPIELIVPSISFGLLYLLFGLLPGIILHFSFDAFWFAMPFFASTAAGIRLQQIMVVAMVFVPLWIVLARRVAIGRWVDLSPAETNGAWQPAPVGVAVAEPVARPIPSGARLTPAQARLILIVGALPAAAWIVMAVRLPTERQPIRTSRRDAAAAARAALASANLGPLWRFLPVAEEGGGPAHRFIWTTAGSTTYATLLGGYLNRPGWIVFVRTFDGDVAERAENWTVRLDAAAVVQRVTHQLPESRAGGALDVTAARQLAVTTLRQRFGLDPSQLKEVSAAPAKLPQRTDWTMTFRDAALTLPQGEPRLTVQLSGDAVTDVRRFVFVPEDWQRARRNGETIASIVRVGETVLGAVMALAGVIAALVSWSRRRFSVGLFLAVFGAFLALSAVRVINSFPVVMAGLSTSQPLQLQLLVLIGSSAVGLALVSAATGLIAGAVAPWSAGQRLNSRRALELGLAVGAVAAAARAASALIGADGPMWPDYAGAAAIVPVLAAATTPVISALTRTAFVLLVVTAANQLSRDWTERRVLVGVLLALAGGLLGGVGAPDNPIPWIASTAVIGGLLAAAYVLVLRHDVRTVPIAVAVMTAAATLREGWSRAYPGALAGSLVGIAMVGLAAYGWFSALRSPAVPNRAGTV